MMQYFDTITISGNLNTTPCYYNVNHEYIKLYSPTIIVYIDRDVKPPFSDIVIRIWTLNVTSSLHNVTEVAVTYNLIVQ